MLWRKVKPGLSAGRVQSPAIRLIVERERERMRFRSVTYWDVTAQHPTSPAFESTLTSVDGRARRQRQGLRRAGRAHLRRAALARRGRTRRRLAERARGRPFTVRSLEKKPYRSSPKPPFMTSTLQQEGGRKLRHERAAGDARGPGALRARLHHLHAHRLHHALGDRARRGARRRSASSSATSSSRPQPRAYAEEVEERAGGPRGHPPRRRGLPHARGAGRRAQRRRAEALRADLEAHPRLPDGRRRGRVGGRQARRRAPPAARRLRVQRLGPHHHLPRLPARLRRGQPTTPRRRSTTRSRRCRSSREGDDRAGRRARAERPHHLAAGPLHRGLAGEEAGGARHRPPLHLRLDHGHAARRATSGRRARRWSRTGSPSRW